MKREDIVILIGIASLIGSAYVMKKFAPLIKTEKQKEDTTSQGGKKPTESVF